MGPLLDAGADPAAADGRGLTPLDHLARGRGRWWAAASARLLVARGADPAAVRPDPDDPWVRDRLAALLNPSRDLPDEDAAGRRRRLW